MKKLMAVLILISFAVPARAGLVGDFEPIEKKLTTDQRITEEMNKGLKGSDELKSGTKETSSSWWKWALGILVVGGIAAAAAGGGGSSPSGPPSGSTGVAVTW